MISCKLQGRTGNQMFQIAAGYAHAKRNGFQFVVPPTSTNEQLWPSHKYKKLKYQRITGNIYDEPHFHYAPIPNDDNLIINGYFQSVKYFEEYGAEIQEAFGFEMEIEPGTVAVHVRRGDYLTYNKEFNPLPAEWYMDAIKTFDDHHIFHFYSDDIEWCKENFSGINCEFHSGLPMRDLIDGAKKQHCIMSASSFSWWMAYAGWNKDQRVIAPATWFGPKNQHHNTKDLYLPQWKLL